jgi:hypothetical protein
MRHPRRRVFRNPSGGQSRAAFEGNVRSHGLRVACPGEFDKRSRALLARPLNFKSTAAKRCIQPTYRRR